MNNNYNHYEIAYFLAATCEFIFRYLEDQTEDKKFAKDTARLQNELGKIIDKYRNYEAIIDG